jgi:hypothetical protein
MPNNKDHHFNLRHQSGLMEYEIRAKILVNETRAVESSSQGNRLSREHSSKEFDEQCNAGGLTWPTREYCSD